MSEPRLLPQQSEGWVSRALDAEAEVERLREALASIRLRAHIARQDGSHEGLAISMEVIERRAMDAMQKEDGS